MANNNTNPSYGPGDWVWGPITNKMATPGAYLQPVTVVSFPANSVKAGDIVTIKGQITSIRNTIQIDGNTYEVTPELLDQLPEFLDELKRLKKLRKKYNL